jgi:hypothetical protein
MKIRTLLLLVIGIGIGYAIANRMREDDPNVVTGPQRRTGRTVSIQAQKLADQATMKSLELVKRARGSIRDRMASNGDDAVWN